MKEYSKNVFRSLSIIIKIGASVWAIIFFLSALKYVTFKVETDQDIYCATYQIEFRKTPNDCSNFRKRSNVKLIGTILTGTLADRKRIARDAYGEKEVYWSQNLSSIVYDPDLDNKIRLQRFLEENPALSSYAQAYQNAFSQTAEQRNASLHSYEKAKRHNNTAWAEMKRRTILSTFWISVIMHAISNILASAIVILTSRTKRFNDTIDIAILCAIFPIIPISLLAETIYVSIGNLRKSRRLRKEAITERKRIREELGEDVVQFLIEIDVIEERLRSKTLSTDEQERLNTQLHSVQEKIKQLRTERQRTHTYLQTLPPSEAEELKKLLDDLRIRIEATLTTEQEAQARTEIGLAVRIDECDESNSPPTRKERTSESGLEAVMNALPR